MVLLENVIVLAIAVAAVLLLHILSIRSAARWIFSSAAVVIEILVAVLLLFAGASVEELYLMLLIFGAVSVSVYYYAKPSQKNDADNKIEKETSNGI